MDPSPQATEHDPGHHTLDVATPSGTAPLRAPSRRGRLALHATAGPLRAVSVIGGSVGARAADRALQAVGRRCPPMSVRVHRRGFTWDLDLADNIQRTIFFTGVYDPRLLALLYSELRRGDVFYDIGANIGAIAIPVACELKRLGGGTVQAIEPAPANQRKLREHASCNAVSEVVAIAPQAFGQEDGFVPIMASSDFGAGDCGTWSQFGDGPVVAHAPMERGDDFVQRVGPSPTIIKIDVEGAELQVISGLAQTLRRDRPRLLVVELVDGHQQRAGSSTAEVVELLDHLGYRPTAPRRSGLRRDRSLEGNVAFRPTELLAAGPD